MLFSPSSHPIFMMPSTTTAASHPTENAAAFRSNTRVVEIAGARGKCTAGDECLYYLQFEQSKYSSLLLHVHGYDYGHVYGSGSVKSGQWAMVLMAAMTTELLQPADLQILQKRMKAKFAIDSGNPLLLVVACNNTNI